MAKDTREALAVSSANFYKNPSKKFKLIGVTGTKGKTTTTFMIKEILEKAGKKVGLIGTIATYINGKKLKDSYRTTPERLELQNILIELSEQLNFIDLEVDDIILRCEKSVEIILKSLEKIKSIIYKSGFKTEQEEITFF